ncbi:uncharacterized protein LOC117322446 [Pecten maximus]|uniref:uncharacterized protein LOC117322446 n=1 Tax=Pecten maximus TaxID=6579 RepID=UPI001458416B|nr:uncharacterized protein LOC117322446 [Pecten maximus]
MYCVLVVAVCLFGQICGMTTFTPTTHRHHVHESNEFDQGLFYYDAKSHQMVMKLGSRCYIEKLKASQRPQVHTTDGLLKMESNLMFLVAKGTQTQMSHDDVNDLSMHVEHMCAGQDVFVVSHPHHGHTTVPTTMGVIG